MSAFTFPIVTPLKKLFAENAGRPYTKRRGGVLCMSLAYKLGFSFIQYVIFRLPGEYI